MIHPAPLPSPDLLELHARLDKLERMLERALAPAVAQREFMTAKEAAAHLGIALSTLWKMSSARVLPYHKSGRLLRFAKADLDRYLESRRRPSREEIESAAVATAMKIIGSR